MALKAGIAGLVIGLVTGAAAALMRERGVRVPYTRKLFHFGIFSGAAAVHLAWGLPGTNTYGATVAAIVLAAVARGDGDALYESLARDTDRPRRSLFIVVPLVTTAIGGLASALISGPYAVVGYLVAGWGDAIGEPVGTRWGRHPYSVPSLAGVRAERTLEGSAAVFIVGWVAAWVALASSGSSEGVVLAAFVCAVVGAAVEAATSHGLDNLTVQVAVSVTAAWLMG